MSRAANRMNAGRVQSKRGTKVAADSRQQRVPAGVSAWSRTRRAALLKVLDRQALPQKLSVLAELRDQGTRDSRALKAELEERWGFCLVDSDLTQVK